MFGGGDAEFCGDGGECSDGMCVAEAASEQCGGNGEPCCDGDMCNGAFTCNDEGTCEFGGGGGQ
jgi:hypothetical protein